MFYPTLQKCSFKAIGQQREQDHHTISKQATPPKFELLEMPSLNVFTSIF